MRKILNLHQIKLKFHKIKYQKFLTFLRKMPPQQIVLLILSILVILSIGSVSVIGLSQKKKSIISPSPTVMLSPSEPTLSPTTAVTFGPTAATPIPTQVTQPQVTVTNSPTAAPTSVPTQASDTTPPSISSMTGPDNGSTITSNNFCFPMTLSDNVSKYPDILVRTQFDSNSWTDWTTNVSPCYSNISNGSHTFSAQAKDQAGNISSTVSRTFTVNVQQNITVSLNGQLFNDTNCNKTIDSGEAGIPNISITIMQSDGSVLSNVTTDANGNYSFSKDIAPNANLSLQPAPNDHTYGFTIPPAVTLNANNKSATLNLSHCP